MTDTPSLDPIRELEDACLRVGVMRAALELGLFSLIQAGFDDPDRIAAKLEIDARGVAVLLRALAGMGALTWAASCDGPRYELSAWARAFLVRENPGYYGDSCLELTMSERIATQLSQAVRLNQPLLRPGSVEDSARLWVSDFAPWRVTWPRQAERARALWQRVGVECGADDLVILDAACGPAVNTLVLLEDRPRARLTAMDKYPEVLAMAGEMAHALEVANHVEYVVGDIHTADFGDARYDVIYFGAILYMFEAQALRAVMAKSVRALRPGGYLVIHHVLGDESRAPDEAEGLLGTHLFLLHPTSHVHAFSDYEVMLGELGLVEIERVDACALSARKPELSTSA